MTAAEEFELSTKSRGEELKALATAKKVIKESTGGAAEQTYGLNQVSLLQLSSSADLAKFEAVRFVRDLARKSNSASLAQLASRMSSAMKLGAAAGEDPFSKVKSLITDMIATLEDEAEADADLGEDDGDISDLSARMGGMGSGMGGMDMESLMADMGCMPCMGGMGGGPLDDWPEKKGGDRKRFPLDPPATKKEITVTFKTNRQRRRAFRPWQVAAKSCRCCSPSRSNPSGRPC